jgi:hypothetical protein
MPSNMTPPYDPITWTVDAQMATAGADKSGKIVPGYEVRFTLSTGHTDSVFVAGTEYSVAGVRAAITAKAEQLAAIARLSGTVGQE